MDMGGFIAVLAAVSGMVLSWRGGAKAIKDEIAQEAGTDAVLHAEVAFLQRRSDTFEQEFRSQMRRVEDLSERIARLEEFSNQVHKRLDRLEE